MSDGTLRGEFEILVLAAVLRLEDGAYGASIYREIEERTGRSVSVGAVYTTLSRLEEKGMVASFEGEPTPVRGGRAKRLFRIRAAGVQALRGSASALSSLLAGTELAWS